ncbi:hypothetical protein KKF38_01130, partial [Patescibacteria group bacterium]|nr:hypothetical protein [Patescibacteria group bacterium]
MFNAIESIPNTINYCSRIIREKIDSLLSAPKNVGIKIIDTKMEDDILRINIDISNSDKERLLQKVNIGFIFWKNKKQIYDYTFSVSEFIGSEEKSTFEI